MSGRGSSTSLVASGCPRQHGRIFVELSVPSSLSTPGIVQDGSIRGVFVESKAGRGAILAKRVVDTTGDGQVLYRAPTIPVQVDYNLHGFVPLIPRGESRIYCFGTQPIWRRYSCARGLHENAPIGFRWSGADGVRR